jgi:hypothetical protein
MVKKNNKVLYISIVSISVIVIGIVIWGFLTNWKFWNYSKKENKYPYIPDNVPVKHACHKSKCKHCNSLGTVCEECDPEYIKNSNNKCIYKKNCASEDCETCDPSGKNCETCKGELRVDNDGKCCKPQNLVNGVCCKNACTTKTETSDGKGTLKNHICCDDGSECVTSQSTFLAKCCKKGQILGNDGKCCDAIDKLTGQCCDKDLLDTDEHCCNGTNEKIVDGKCKLTCGDKKCDPKTQECIQEGTTAYCKDIECKWDQKDSIPKYFPPIISGLKGGQQYQPCTIFDVDDEKIVQSDLTDTNNRKYYNFLKKDDSLSSKYQFGKEETLTQKQNGKCTTNDCQGKMSGDGSFISFQNNKCLGLKSEQCPVPSMKLTDCETNLNDTTGQRCCKNENNVFTGQICDKYEICAWDTSKGLSECVPQVDCLKNGKICNGNGTCKYNPATKKGECKCVDINTLSDAKVDGKLVKNFDKYCGLVTDYSKCSTHFDPYKVTTYVWPPGGTGAPFCGDTEQGGEICRGKTKLTRGSKNNFNYNGPNGSCCKKQWDITCGGLVNNGDIPDCMSDRGC